MKSLHKKLAVILLIDAFIIHSVTGGYAKKWTEDKCSPTSLPDHVAATAATYTESTKPRALVTGAAGFIASHVAQYAAEQMKFHVVAVDDLSGGFMRNVRPIYKHGGVFVKGDVGNDTFVRELFEQHGPFDYVYHLAAYAAEGLSHFIRRYNYNNNLVASITLINAAVRQQSRKVQRYVFTSSIAAYGAVEDPSELPMTEETPQRPEDPYGVAKHSVELDLKAATHMFGLPYTIFRPHNVYGPRQNIADKFRNAVGIFMNQILMGQDITIFGSGEQQRAFSYIDDVAPLIAASVLYPNAAGQDFFVGVDDPYTVNALAKMTRTAMDKPDHPIVHLDARKEVSEAFASHAKLRCFFKPAPPTSLAKGLQITADYVKKHGSYPPTGYRNIEVEHNMPPSWTVWLKNTPTLDAAKEKKEKNLRAKRSI